MCGIAGFIVNEKQFDGLSVLENMLESIAHRGPDYRGLWQQNQAFLGHNRLSIIDLSEGANQPFHFAQFSIVFNGEVYNYLEIREELIRLGHRFLTDSDTEVILHAYAVWGELCVNKFVGMWSLAIWDSQKEELFCSRDRFGIKPFYYIDSGTGFYFSSEIKALKKSPVWGGGINDFQVALGLQMGWLSFDEQTYFSQVRQLKPAHNLTVNKQGKLTVSCYWQLQAGINEIPLADAILEFRERFLSSVNLHLRSDVEIGTCLSGGLDSSAIVSAVSKQSPDKPLHAFHIYYEGAGEVDERKWVYEVVKKYPNVEPVYFSPGEADLQEAFERALYHADVPLAGSSPVSQYFVMQLAAKKGIKVLLDGQGSDEYLAGYPHFMYRFLAPYLKGLKFSRYSKELASFEVMGEAGKKKLDTFIKTALTACLSEQSLYRLELKNYLPYLPEVSFRNKLALPVLGDKMQTFSLNMLGNTSLSSLLHYEDRNSMAYSIESRVPFLDHRLVEYAFNLPHNFKLNKGVSKYILREAMQGILPEAILNRTDKKGFVTPGEVKWLRGSLSYLLAQKIEVPGVNTKRASQLIEEFKKGNNSYANLVWRIVVLNKWMKDQ